MSRALLALAAFAVTPLLHAQTRGLVVPVPPEAAVTVTADSFTAGDGMRRRFEVYRPRRATGPIPAMVFVNVIGPELPTWPGYVDWARLVTGGGLAAVHYEGPGFDAGQSRDWNLARANATLDSVLQVLARRGPRLGVDGNRLVIWAASANTTTGTPVALSGRRPGIAGYILYYGAGEVAEPRIDVPVFIARAGLDAPGLNRSLDSLAGRLIAAGVPVTVANHPAGRHGFDLLDSTAVTARIIEQTIDFARAVVQPGFREAVTAGTGEVGAAAAFTAGRWAEAVAKYREVAAVRPEAGGVHWRLGLAQLESGDPAGALASFDRARGLGVGGARDIGLPAARAAVRSGSRADAARWVIWALGSFPRIRQEIAADSELAWLLEDPDVRAAASPPR